MRRLLAALLLTSASPLCAAKPLALVQTLTCTVRVSRS